MSLENIYRFSATTLALVIFNFIITNYVNAASFEVSTTSQLRTALMSAATNLENDEIVLSEGTYFTDDSEFMFTTNESMSLTLRGATGTSLGEVVLDGGNTTRVFSATCAGNCRSNIIFSDLLIRNGQTDGNGAGLLMSSYGTLTINDSAFEDNVSNDGSGGGIYVAQGQFTQTAIINNSQFSGNSAYRGGGIHSYGPNLHVINSTFEMNVAENSNGSGGAIYSNMVKIENSSFNQNSAGTGGALSIGFGQVIGSLFSNNDATQEGGAIWSFVTGAHTLIVNCTFYMNSTRTNDGAAIYVKDTGSVVNSLFFDNFGGNTIYFQSSYNLYNNLINVDSELGGGAPIKNNNISPKSTSPFIDATSDNFRLDIGSAAIDSGLEPTSPAFTNLHGNNSRDSIDDSLSATQESLSTDLQGHIRPATGTHVDIGAFEYGSATNTLITTESDCLFNWGEDNYPSLLTPSRPSSQSSSPYYFRYYSGSNTYLGYSSANDHLYSLAADGVLNDLGLAATWSTQAGCR